eukprot:CAMPEP_0185800044 /NCGR_PEP_ID=MMETSP1322-20130828/662_1 /TAXON_ID=265543 /ORGANISM="Minutocellus polymorphus, Strain RCC2270" /LENGTH=289 /DNA_ID=CAMNT_0028495659 /DNA_START=71 /DNA_END=940 /DNA_ORIENTATION=+
MPSTKVSSLVALATALCATSGSAFAFGGARSPQVAVVPSASSAPILSPSVLRMSDEEEGYDYPSDSSSEEHYETDKEAVDVETEGPNDVEAQVDSVFDLLPADLAAIDSMGSAKRADINEALLRLEQMNPTEEAAYSLLLNGVWTLRYAGGYSNEWALPSPTRQLALFLYSGGYSPGLFALSLAQKLPKALVELGELEISISREQPRIEATVPVKFLGGTENEVVVSARLDVDSSVRLTETYESATVLGNSIDLPQAVQYSRDLYVTYVDDDLLVVRDASGVPEVLVRK